MIPESADRWAFKLYMVLAIFILALLVCCPPQSWAQPESDHDRIIQMSGQLEQTLDLMLELDAQQDIRTQEAIEDALATAEWRARIDETIKNLGGLVAETRAWVIGIACVTVLMAGGIVLYQIKRGGRAGD